MPFRNRRGNEIAGLGLPRVKHRGRSRRWVLWAVLAVAVCFVLRVGGYLRSATAFAALSEARDSITASVNGAVARVLREGNYGYGSFVRLEKDAAGQITAMQTDAERVNLFATEVLREITGAARSGGFDLRIPLGSLLGSDLLLGRGPEISVRIFMNTSPELRFETQFTSAGINQTRHSLYLRASVDADVYLPWSTAETRAEAGVLVAETILLGRVPDTFVTMEDSYGYAGSERED